MPSSAPRKIHPLAVAALLIFTLLLVYVSIRLVDSTRDKMRQNRVRQGSTAPDFRLTALDGRRINLADQRGKVVLVNIWATWCRPCVEEMPSMERLYKRMKGKPFEILAVSVDAEGRETVAPFARAHNLSFPILLDPEGTVRDLYGVTGVPETFLLDPDGKIIRKIVGQMQWDRDEVVSYITALIQYK